MRKTDRVVLASLNAAKFEEWSFILKKMKPDWVLVPPEEMLHNTRLLEGVEVFDTYLGNALAKARLVNRGCHYPTLADDSGIEVAALPGMLGVHSKRFQGGTHSDLGNMEALLERMQGVKDRRAVMRCVAVLVMEGISFVGEGSLEGTLLEMPRGTQGFGYDPIFQPLGQPLGQPSGKERSLAELSMEEKNLCSHRYKAFQHLFTQLEERSIQLVRP